MESKDITKVAVFAALYAVLGYVFHGISFLAFQVRIACALIPLIALYGWSSIIGITIGGLILNASSPLGILDMASMFIFIPAKLAIHKWGMRATPLHVISVSLWVGYMLNAVFGLPFWPMVISVGIGETIAEIILGVPLAKLVERYATI